MIIKTATELNKAIRSSAGIDLDDFAPLIEAAEEFYLIPILGETYYTAFEAAYTADTIADAKDIALLKKVQRFIANIALHNYADTGNVVLNSSGIMRVEDDQHKTAYKYQIDNLKEQTLINAWNQKEVIMRYLKNNTDHFTDWVADYDAQVYAYGLMINTTKDFDEVININSNGYVYQQLRNFIKEAEDFIKSATCSALFTEIKTELIADNLSVNNQYLYDTYIKEAAAYKAMAEASLEMQVVNKGNGFKFTYEKSTDGTNSDPVDSGYIATLREKWRNKADAALSDLAAYLQENADTYPTFKTSTCYIDPDTITEDDDDTNASPAGIHII